MASMQYNKEKLNTLLIKAVAAGNIKNAKNLLKQGADVDARDENGWTAMMLAVWMRHFDFADYLLDNGANIDAKDIY